MGGCALGAHLFLRYEASFDTVDDKVAASVVLALRRRAITNVQVAQAGAHHAGHATQQNVWVHCPLGHFTLTVLHHNVVVHGLNEAVRGVRKPALAAGVRRHLLFEAVKLLNGGAHHVATAKVDHVACLAVGMRRPAVRILRANEWERVIHKVVVRLELVCHDPTAADQIRNARPHHALIRSLRLFVKSCRLHDTMHTSA